MRTANTGVLLFERVCVCVCACVCMCVCLSRPPWRQPRSFDWFVKSLKSQLVNKRLGVVSAELEDKLKISLIIRCPHTDTHPILGICAQLYFCKHCLIFSPTYLFDIFPLNMTSPQHQRRSDFSLICVQINFFFCLAPLNKTTVSSGLAPRIISVWGEHAENVITSLVSQQLRNTARLSLITNKVAQIFKKKTLLRAGEWQLCGERRHPSGVITFNSVVPPYVCYQASDPPRLALPINKIEVFVYSSADSTGDKKKKRRSSGWNGGTVRAGKKL